jgi:peptide/nickel transport system ATP-binding protein
MPDPTKLPSGCKFHPRCPKAAPICAERVPVMTKLKDGHEVSCMIYEGLVKADGGANA